LSVQSVGGCVAAERRLAPNPRSAGLRVVGGLARCQSSSRRPNMTTQANTDDAASAAAKPQPTKSEIVVRLLSRKAGATVDELGDVTKWQPHSVRAYLSGLRKKGTNIAREERRDG